MRLQGKVAIVTGAAAGMGRSIALLFAKEGAKVVVSDVNAEGLKAVADEIKAAGGSVLTVVGSVASQADVDKMFDEGLKAYGGRIDIVINNAGILDDFAVLETVSDEVWARVMNVNVNGPMMVSRRALQIMVPQGGGSIVNISSVGGSFGARGGVAYVTTKHALIGLTRNTAYVYAQKGIRCNAIAPGPVATTIGSKNPDMFGYSRLQPTMAMIIRQGQPEEVATAALFLASDEASFVNGAVLTVDGGWTAG